MRFAKGHGTGNDFVIIPDLDAALDLTPELVAALCDRHFGLGADGVLRIVPTAALVTSSRTPQPAPFALTRDADWFMDYRNADGSVAEMCGNGIRVFVKYLLDEGLARGPEVAIATRAGTRVVRAHLDGQFTADLGGAVVLGEGSVDVGGRRLTGLAVSVGNPHLACVIGEPVGAVDLGAPQVLAPAELTKGANVEVVQITGDHEADMRVHERGSGLTLSCGTGAVAAAVAAAARAEEWPDSRAPWTVHVPGGTLAVTPGATASLLTGPAEIVARGEVEAGWLAGQRRLAPVGTA